MIRLEKVCFSYANRRVFEELEMKIDPGVTLLLGPNGSGKSTLLKIIAGVEQPERGRVRIDGHDLWHREVEARRLLAYVPEQPDVSPLARIDEVIGLVCGLREMPRDHAMKALEAVGLARLRSCSVRDLSLGQRRRVLLAAAMVGAPRVLLLDEPLETMDRSMHDLIIDWIARHKTQGGTAVVATHELHAFARLTDRAIGLDDGRVIATRGMPSPTGERLSVLDDLARGVVKDRP